MTFVVLYKGDRDLTLVRDNRAIGITWIARADTDVRNHILDDRIVRAQNLEHALFYDPRDRVRHHGIRTDRQLDVDKGVVRLSIREERWRLSVPRRQHNGRNEQHNHAEHDPVCTESGQRPTQRRSVLIHEPRQQARLEFDDELRRDVDAIQNVEDQRSDRKRCDPKSTRGNRYQ